MGRYDSYNLTLAELREWPIDLTKAGREGRLKCPFHPGTNPTSFSVCFETGKFYCFSCGVKGMLLDYRYGTPEIPTITNWSEALLLSRKKSEKAAKNLEKRLLLLKKGQNQLHLGKAYLAARGISLVTAAAHGLGYHPHFRFVSFTPPYREEYYPAILFPTTGPEGFVNFYARAISQKRLHFIPPGAKGLFNFQAIEQQTAAPLILTEGAFDALAMLEAGYVRVAALIGLGLNNPQWYCGVSRVILALDEDEAGRTALPRLAHTLKREGVKPYAFPAGIWQGEKDFNGFWQRYQTQIKLNWDKLLNTAYPL